MSVRRLSVYFRCLAQLEEDGVKTISSQELAARFHLNSAQVRKDLAYFGEFGIRGIGYDTTNLRAEIQRILGLDREWRVVLVGFGNLGSALFHYRGFARQGFRIAAIVDDDPAKVGRAVNGLSDPGAGRAAARREGTGDPDRRRRGARPRRRRASPTGWSRPASGRSSTSRRAASRCRRTCASRTSTSRSSWRTCPSIWGRRRGERERGGDARRGEPPHLGRVGRPRPGARRARAGAEPDPARGAVGLRRVAGPGCAPPADPRRDRGRGGRADGAPRARRSPGLRRSARPEGARRDRPAARAARGPLARCGRARGGRGPGRDPGPAPPRRAPVGDPARPAVSRRRSRAPPTSGARS